MEGKKLSCPSGAFFSSCHDKILRQEKGSVWLIVIVVIVPHIRKITAVGASEDWFYYIHSQEQKQ